MRGMPRAVAVGFAVMLMGVFLGYLVLYMDGQGVIIDQITNPSFTAGELAFGIFFTFVLIGLFVMLLGGVSWR